MNNFSNLKYQKIMLSKNSNNYFDNVVPTVALHLVTIY